MNTPHTPRQLLEQMAQIQHMEVGKLCIMRQGPSGPYFTLQYRKDGKPVCQYIPRDQVERVAENTANHKKFQALVEEYTEQIIEQTRREREEGLKKKTASNGSVSRRRTKSKL